MRVCENERQMKLCKLTVCNRKASHRVGYKYTNQSQQEELPDSCGW